MGRTGEAIGAESVWDQRCLSTTQRLGMVTVANTSPVPPYNLQACVCDTLGRGQGRPVAVVFTGGLSPRGLTGDPGHTAGDSGLEAVAPPLPGPACRRPVKALGGPPGGEWSSLVVVGHRRSVTFPVAVSSPNLPDT